MNKYDRPEDLGYTYTWENMPRDEEGFIQLIPKHPIGKTDSFKRRFMYTDQPEIILHHGHISITNYKMGDNFEFEKSLSVWNKMTFRYELIGGYYISEYREFCINRGYDLQRLKNFFPDRPMRVVNDPFPSDPIDIELYTGPRDDFQKVALTFMTHQGMYESIKHTQELIDIPTGGGKAMPDDTLVATPTGFVRFDSLKVGDYVIGANGKKTKVLGIYPQKGLQRTYEITFKDGRTARCNAEHLWKVKSKKWRTGPKVRPLSELLKDYKVSRDNGYRTTHMYAIPLPEPIHFKHQDVPIDPYLLGVFIGNGCLTETALTLSSGNIEVPLEVSKLLNAPTRLRTTNNYSYTFIKPEKGTSIKLVQTKKIFKDFPEFIGAKSEDKYIPDVYLYNDIETRWSLLQGLMDTDGHITKDKYQLSYTTTSKKLKDGFVELVRSLGYVAMVTHDKRSKYKSGICYEIMITSVPDKDKPKFFRVNKKSLKRAKEGTNYKTNKVMGWINIMDIKEVEPTKQRCIKVDADDHLYVTKDYVVTHNTYCGVATTAYWNHKTIVFVPFSKLLDQWKSAYTDYTSLSDKDIMIIQGSNACEKILAGKCKHIKVFVCSMDTIASFQKKYGNLRTIELLKATGAYIKIIDEIHRDIRAVSMIEALSNFRLNYYMSASPGRAEQKENWIFRTLFKNVPSFGGDFQTQEEKHITVMIKKFKWTPDYKQIKAMVNNKTGLNIKAYERELINSPQFQRQSFDDAIMVLLNWAKGVMKPGKRLMLMAQSIETLFYIQKLAEKVFPGETGVYYGGLSKKEKELAIEKKIIIATDSSLGTGANIPELQFLIYCSTYSNWLNARQISGRLRKLNDGTQVVYIELLNVGYLKTMKQFDKRKGELQRRSKTGKLFFVE